MITFLCRRWVGLLCFVACVVPLVAQESPPLRRRVLVSPTADGATGQIQVPAMPPTVFTFAGGLTLTMHRTEALTTFVDAGGKVLYSIGKPQNVTTMGGWAVSPKGTAAILLINRMEGHGGWYSHLLQITVAKGAFRFEKIWPEGQELVSGHRWWISRVGAVSDDGNTLLAEFGVSPKGPGMVNYTWETWSILPPKQLGTGLTVENGIRSAK